MGYDVFPISMTDSDAALRLTVSVIFCAPPGSAICNSFVTKAEGGARRKPVDKFAMGGTSND
jgi:hypothetical protein